MSLAEIERAERAARLAQARFDATLAEVQQRLRPRNLASEAWGGVKEKSANLADDAVQAVKARPGTVSLALGALTLFLARAPLKKAVGGLISNEDKAKAGTPRKGKRSPVGQVQGTEDAVESRSRKRQRDS